jgi:cobalt-zinc-cadmium resistance protein CzcA
MQDWIVKFNLQTVPGVTEVLGIGGFEKQFQVIVDPDALLRYGVTLADLIERIEANNLNVGAQYIEKGGSNSSSAPWDWPPVWRISNGL